MTDRDRKIIELVKACDVITREQIQQVLFKEVHHNVPIRRLKLLVDNKEIKRSYYNVSDNKNVYVYYMNRKPSKRNLKHNLMVTEFITRVMNICEVVEVKTNYQIGNIMSDAYLKYKTTEGKIKHLFLEVQLSNKVSDCISKYEDIRNIILNERADWATVPRLVVITDLRHDFEQMKNIKIKYDSLKMENIRDLIFGEV